MFIPLQQSIELTPPREFQSPNEHGWQKSLIEVLTQWFVVQEYISNNTSVMYFIS